MTVTKYSTVYISLLLSAANILGSSGLLVWIDHVIRDETQDLSAYYPLISYLMGLSLGCCLIGAVSVRNKSVTSRQFFLYSLIFATCTCFIIAIAEGATYEWFGLLLRFLWGGVSGCTVILSRAMLASSESIHQARRNFSVLSLALTTLPLIIPTFFAFLVIYQRSASAIFASIMYGITTLLFLLGETCPNVENPNFNTRIINLKNATVCCISLVILNSCFFLALMLVPMIMTRSYADISIVNFYLIVLGLWLCLGWLILRCSQFISIKMRMGVGCFFKIATLICCFWIIYWGDQFVFVFVIFFMFLSTILIQPMLLLILGWGVVQSCYCSEFNLGCTSLWSL